MDKREPTSSPMNNGKDPVTAAAASSSSLRTPYFRSEHESLHEGTGAPLPPKLQLETKLNFQYRGDVFGQHGAYSDGNVYMSRLPSSRKGSILRPKPGAAYRIPGMKLVPMQQQTQGQLPAATQQQQTQQTQREKTSGMKISKSNRKRQYALAVEAMASNEILRCNLLSDNVIPNLLALLRTKDTATLASCVATLCYLSREPLGREAILKNSSLVLLTNLASALPLGPTDKSSSTLLHNYLGMLANLTIEDTFESVFVKEKALDSIMKHRKASLTAEQMTAFSLLNLSCPLYSYPRVDDVIRAIVHDFGRDGAMSDDQRLTLSQALFNLSCTRLNQTKLVEGDALGMLRGMLVLPRRESTDVSAPMSKTDAVRLNALMVLWHLAENPQCRRAITRPDCMRALVDQLHKSAAAAVTDDHLKCTLMVLVCLASDEVARQRLGKADALDALALLVTRFKDHDRKGELVAVLYRLMALLLSTSATIEGVSRSFLAFLLSFQHNCHLDEHASTSNVSRYVLFSLACVLWWNDNDEDANLNRASDSANRPTIDELLDDQALLEPLLKHVEADGFAIDSAEAFLQLVLLYNLAFRYSKADVARRAAPRLKALALSSSNARILSMICGTLFCLTQEYQTHVLLHAAGVFDVLPILIERCSSHDQIDDTSTMSLDIVCVVFDGRMLGRSELVTIMTSVAPSLVRLCETTQSAALRASCAACFARFASSEECRGVMAQHGVIRALAILANEEDANTLRLCVHAYSHLSRDAQICALLIQSGIIKSLTFLAAAPEEAVRRACAMTLCNLSTSEENIGALAKAGALKALLVISCVKSNDPETRRICMKAVMNLLRLASIIPLLCQDGLLWAYGLFTSGMEPKDHDILCDGFCALTFYPATRKGAVKPAILTAMLQVFDSPTASILTKAKLLKALSNALCDLPHAAQLINAGVLPRLVVIVDRLSVQHPPSDGCHMVGDAHMLVAQILVLIFQSCPDAESEFAEPEMLTTITRLIQTKHDDCSRCVAILLYQMSLHTTTRGKLVETAAGSPSSSLMDAVPQLFCRVARETQALLVRLIYNVSCDEDSRGRLNATQIVQCLCHAIPKKIAAMAFDVAALCAGLLRNLSCETASHDALMEEQATTLLKKLFEVDDDGCKEDAAVCLCNLFMGHVNSSALLSRSVLPMVLWLCSSRATSESRQLGTTVVRKLALAPGNTQVLVDGGVISHLALLLHECSSLFVKKNCIATFCCVARKPSVPAILASYGVVANVLELVQVEAAQDPLLEAMCVDLLSSLAEFARAEDPLESKLASILYHLLETEDATVSGSASNGRRGGSFAATTWQTDRSFLVRGAGAPLAPASLSGAHLRVSAKPPTLRHTLYPIRFAGFSVDFSHMASRIELRTVEPLLPALSIIGEKVVSADSAEGTVNTSSSQPGLSSSPMAPLSGSARHDFTNIAAPSLLAFTPLPMFPKLRTAFAASPSTQQLQRQHQLG